MTRRRRVYTRGVKPGAICARDVSRCFRVYPEHSLTLKEAIVRRRHLRPRDIWALRDVSLEIQPGESVGLDGSMPMKLTIGNAAATQVSFRGKALDLAPHTRRDNVARIELK